MLGVPNEVWALNPANGKLRWLAETRIPGNVSPSVVQGGDSVFVFGGYPQRGTVAIKTGGSRDVTSSHVRCEPRRRPMCRHRFIATGIFTSSTIRVACSVSKRRTER